MLTEQQTTQRPIDDETLWGIPPYELLTAECGDSTDFFTAENAEDAEFICVICGNWRLVQQEMGNAERDGKPINACIYCCLKEEKRQFFESH